MVGVEPMESVQHLRSVNAQPAGKEQHVMSLHAHRSALMEASASLRIRVPALPHGPAGGAQSRSARARLLARAPVVAMVAAPLPTRAPAVTDGQVLVVTCLHAMVTVVLRLAVHMVCALRHTSVNAWLGGVERTASIWAVVQSAQPMEHATEASASVPRGTLGNTARSSTVSVRMAVCVWPQGLVSAHQSGRARSAPSQSVKGTQQQGVHVLGMVIVAHLGCVVVTGGGMEHNVKRLHAMASLAAVHAIGMANASRMIYASVSQVGVDFGVWSPSVTAFFLVKMPATGMENAWSLKSVNVMQAGVAKGAKSM